MNSPRQADTSVGTDETKTEVRHLWRGRLAIALAAVLWSTSGFFAKAPWFDGWSSELRGMQLAFWRSLFAAIALIPFIRRPRWHPVMLPMCLAFGVMVWTFMSAMVHGPAANAIWLQYLAPAWVLLIGVVFLGEKVSRSDLLMFGCCLTGVLLILFMEAVHSGSATSSDRPQQHSLYATGLGLLSSVMFASVVLMMRKMSDQDSVWLITLNHLATVLLILPWVWNQPLGSIAPGAYVALAMFGIFQLSVPYIIFCRALRTVSGPEASILTLIEPIVLPLWVYVAWRNDPSYEHPHWWTIAGGGLIFTGLVLRYLPLILRSRQPDT